MIRYRIIAADKIRIPGKVNLLRKETGLANGLLHLAMETEIAKIFLLTRR
jgi:hypothetical protein